MARLPDRFDLFVRQARACADPARQVDLILGALFALPVWYFLNIGTREKPDLGKVEYLGMRTVLVYTDTDRVSEILPGATLLSLDRESALQQCLTRHAALLINPGEYTALIPFDQLEAFHAQWIQRGAAQSAGFWIPNMTSQEEDFWQEHGL